MCDLVTAAYAVCIAAILVPGLLIVRHYGDSRRFERLEQEEARRAGRPAEVGSETKFREWLRPKFRALFAVMFAGFVGLAVISAVWGDCPTSTDSGCMHVGRAIASA